MSSGERWLPERVCADRFVAVRQSRRGREFLVRVAVCGAALGNLNKMLSCFIQS